jgi:hypothetical protein
LTPKANFISLLIANDAAWTVTQNQAYRRLFQASARAQADAGKNANLLFSACTWVRALHCPHWQKQMFNGLPGPVQWQLHPIRIELGGQI